MWMWLILLVTADAKILLDSTYVRLDRNGLRTYRHYKVEILTERGRDTYGDVKVRYNNDEYEFNIIRAVTILPDGKEVEPEPKAIADVSPPEVYDAPMYANLRMKVVTFPALKPGAIIDYEYEIVPKKRPKERPKLYGDVVFSEYEPIKKKVFVLEIPKDITLYYNLKPNLYEDGDYTVYVWGYENIRKIKREPYSPSLREIGPTLYYSEFSSWKELGDWLRDQFKTKGKPPQLNYNNIDELVKYMKTDIRTVPISLEWTGFKPNPATKVYANKYADSKDKVALFTTLVDNAYPVLVAPSLFSLDVKIATPSIFTKMMVAIEDEYGFRFEDLADEFGDVGYTRYDGYIGLVVTAHDVKLVPIRNKVRSYEKLRFSGMIDTNGTLTGEFNCHFIGRTAADLRHTLRGKTVAELRKWFEQRVASIKPGCRLVGYEVDGLDTLVRGVIVKIEVECPNYYIENGSLTIPAKILGTDVGRYFQLSKRSNRLTIYEGNRWEYTVTLYMEGFTPTYLPKKTVTTTAFEGKIRSEVKGGTIIWQEEGYIKRCMLCPCKYPEIREEVTSFLLNKWRIVM